MPFEENDFNNNNNQRHQKHENGNAVDAMHVLDPTRVRSIRVPLFDVQVFCNLP